ncbi:hypothetical protein MMEU_2294 [Mycobacterium marinum str. Europe]|nr:hypothetical protein MMEU_2294 [Mycobacterium marinum str. Europe]
MQSVRDDQHGAILGQPIKCLLHQVFRFGIRIRGGLVEDEHRCIGQDGAGDGETLPFAARQRGAGSQHGVVAIAQPQHAVMDLGLAGRGLDLLGRCIGNG